MEKQLLNLSIHICCAFFLTIIYSLLSITLGPVIYFFYLLLAPLTLILYYYLTTKFTLVLTTISFFINFIIWSVELVYLERNFHNSALYQEKFYFFAILLFALLWTVNKLFLDFLFGIFKPHINEMTKLEVLFKTA